MQQNDTEHLKTNSLHLAMILQSSTIWNSFLGTVPVLRIIVDVNRVRCH